MPSVLLVCAQIEPISRQLILFFGGADPEVRVSTRMLRSKRKDANQPEKIKGGAVIPGGVVKKVSGKHAGILLSETYAHSP